MSLKVELVSPTERVWSGEASFVSARTVEGDLTYLRWCSVSMSRTVLDWPRITIDWLTAPKLV